MFRSTIKVESLRFAEGHFGDVHMGDDPIHGKVAVKVLKKIAGESDAEWIARGAELLEEGQNLKKASHANIVQVLNVLSHETTGAIHLVVEFCDGESLESLCKKDPLKLARIRSIIGQVCSGLSAIHGSGLIHRDIKPGNILLHKGNAKIGDFGLVSDRLIYGYASAAGYLDHLAPEVHTHGVTSAKTDGWALGMTIYRLLHGHDFYSANLGSMDIATMVTRGNFATKLPWAPHIPDQWRRLVRRAMNDDIDRRFASANEFNEAVAKLSVHPDWVWKTTSSEDTRTRMDKNRTVTVTLKKVFPSAYTWTATRSGGAKRSISIGSNSKHLKNQKDAYEDLRVFFSAQ